MKDLGVIRQGLVGRIERRGGASHGHRPKRQRITEPIWWDHHEGSHSAEALRLGKQTLCQLSYSRSERHGGPCGGNLPWRPDPDDVSRAVSYTHLTLPTIYSV